LDFTGRINYGTQPTAKQIVPKILKLDLPVDWKVYTTIND